MRSLAEVLVVIHRPGPEFLVALRSPERHGYWNLVAGGIEEGERPRGAALRELNEETRLEGYEVTPIALELGYRRPEGEWVSLHPFAVEVPPGWEPVLNEEHVEHRWCSEEEALRLLAYPEPRAAVREVARTLRRPR